jgi:hypothetical protein
LRPRRAAASLRRAMATHVTIIIGPRGWLGVAGAAAPATGQRRRADPPATRAMSRRASPWR